MFVNKNLVVETVDRNSEHPVYLKKNKYQPIFSPRYLPEVS
jgi:hypothetical protein